MGAAGERAPEWRCRGGAGHIDYARRSIDVRFGPYQIGKAWQSHLACEAASCTMRRIKPVSRLRAFCANRTRRTPVDKGRRMNRGLIGDAKSHAIFAHGGDGLNVELRQTTILN